ncbi:MAG: alpha-galactosidase [Eubacterium sp.]|jgi:alpha-galactosidase|nr:alpha-galactosidase [Eubacterium sp.]
MTVYALKISNKNIAIEFDNGLASRIYTNFTGTYQPVEGFSQAHYPIVNGVQVKNFTKTMTCQSDLKDIRGAGKQYVISGTNDKLEKQITISVYERFPATVFISAQYKNIGSDEITIDGWVNNEYKLPAIKKDSCDNLFWSYQSGSYETRPDWIIPLKEGFYQKNYMGMNASDYGGGTPVSDVWNGETGIAVGHTESIPKMVSLPVSVYNNSAAVSINFDRKVSLKSEETLSTFETFVTVHTGDCFDALSEYRRIMISKGMNFEALTKEAYEPTWCAWGYERDFKMEQIYGALPMVKKLGIRWVCLDDGWQTEEGDYSLIPEKYPNGDADMKKFVDTVHANGFKAQLWWIPLAFDPKSDLYKNHPEYALLNKEGKPENISWWDCYYMCPACEEVIEHTREALKKILIDWDYDGLKIDGQHLNAVPLCFNPMHDHKHENDAYEFVPQYFKMIYDLAREIKPDVTVMFCPCGTSYSIFTMPYFNIPVASDPDSSWQVRTKGKVFKALMGASVPFHGDHVELSDRENDFASTVGIGGVIDTKFTWPVGSGPISILKPDSTYDLSDDREQNWSKWLKLYREKMLPEGMYLGGLYTLGFDFPEGHAIKKDNKMYYAFFSKAWDGEIKLKGLEGKRYLVYDYVNDIEISEVNGLSAEINVRFTNSLLLEVTCISNNA